MLEELHIPVEKTHDLERLLVVLIPHHRSLRTLRRGLKVLANFAVSPRYPGDNTTKRQAASALRWATRARTACRAILGLGP
jgi:HEPN domain-containing protein